MTSANDLAVRRALEMAGIDFIDENGGGPGVRLGKGPEKRRWKRRFGFTFGVVAEFINQNDTGVRFCPENISSVALVRYGEMPYMSPRRVIVPSARKKSASSKREYKSQRLELRIAPSAKKVIQQAMSVTGLAAGDLAYEGARRLLDEHQRMALSGADRDAFLAAIGRKPDPSPRLVEALKRHRDLFG
jgi:uncharacterized protein (DUF1778 family)